MSDGAWNVRHRDKPGVQMPSDEYCAIADKQDEKLFAVSMDDLS